MVNTVWVAHGWADGAGAPASPSRLLGVYKDFETAADFALKAIKEIKRDMYIHGEYTTRIETKFTDGQAQYDLWVSYKENVEFVSDCIVLTRHEVIG